MRHSPLEKKQALSHAVIRNDLALDSANIAKSCGRRGTRKRSKPCGLRSSSPPKRPIDQQAGGLAPWRSPAWRGYSRRPDMDILPANQLIGRPVSTGPAATGLTPAYHFACSLSRAAIRDADPEPAGLCLDPTARATGITRGASHPAGHIPNSVLRRGARRGCRPFRCDPGTGRTWPVASAAR